MQEIREKISFNNRYFSKLQSTSQVIDVDVDETLNWSYDTNNVYTELGSANVVLSTRNSRSKDFLPTSLLKSIFQSLFASHPHFGSRVLTLFFVQFLSTIRAEAFF